MPKTTKAPKQKITIHTPKGSREVAALKVVGVLAVVQVEPKFYTVTHVPTGMKVSPYCPTRAKALAFLAACEPEDPRWEHISHQEDSATTPEELAAFEWAFRQAKAAALHAGLS